MATNPSPNLNRQVRYLRDELAQQITRNLKLESEVDDLNQAQSVLAIDALVKSFIQSMNLANAALDEERREKSFRVSEMEITMPARFAVQGNNLVVNTANSDLDQQVQFGSIQMTLSQIPILHERNPRPAIVRALEEAQAAFATWQSHGPGSKVSQDIMSRLSHLLSIRNNWLDSEFVLAIDALAKRILVFGKSMEKLLPAKNIKVYRDSARILLDHTNRIASLREMRAEDAFVLATDLERVVAAYESLMQNISVTRK